MDEPLSPDMPILHPKISQKIWIYWHSVIATQLLTTEGNRSMLEELLSWPAYAGRLYAILGKLI